MGDNKPIQLDVETLAALYMRLLDHADSIVNVAAHEMEQDIRTAPRALAIFCDAALSHPRNRRYGAARQRRRYRPRSSRCIDRCARQMIALLGKSPD
jgi:hypothetical protein